MQRVFRSYFEWLVRARRTVVASVGFLTDAVFLHASLIAPKAGLKGLQPNRESIDLECEILQLFVAFDLKDDRIARLKVAHHSLKL